ncbi:CbtA family protein [Rubrobacter indicoceani]|uniref:CbtA family protein n=1 Tax=Rubrobacter indicoceani TaxID=2051957 RepID=UPI000E5B9A69|nr:CbtA family protein [Rubrobacter indicoceani]
MFFTYLRRGVLAGLVAGLIAGLFAYSVGEPAIERALLLEEGASEPDGVVSRDRQEIGLIVATVLYAGAMGGVFAVVFSWLRGRGAASDWSRSLGLASVLFSGFFFIPFVKYPSEPPGTGDMETLGLRTAAYLLCLVISLFSLLGAWYLARFLRGRGYTAPVRQVVVGGALVGVLGVLFALLPPATAVGDFPGDVLWSFRVSTVGTQVLIWGMTGVIFGLLGERAARKERRAL